ncbi:MAG: MSMEG_1061 family FMN-dependent PPOX-type flavoprotein [Comamonas sp.]
MITNQAQLRALYPHPTERALRKQLSALDVHCQRFISLSPLCVMATGGGVNSWMDASPRGGAPGFVHVADAHTLWLPDAGGNNRLDSLCNLLDDPRIGLWFVIPGVDETLRINGTVQLRDEATFTQFFATATFVPKLVLEVQVKEAYLHCAKALMRAKLWDVHQHQPRTVLPSMNTMIHDHMGAPAPQESQAQMLARYAQQLAQEQGVAAP